MTRTRYLAWRLGQTFGISLAGRHASHAATEMHLLREAEEVLGRLAWEDIEDLEDLSVEYWNLRKLTKQYDQLAARIDNANVDLQESHERRASLLEMVVDSTKDLVTERSSMVDRAERLGAERDAVLAEARAVKRRHDGIKAKLEVLAGEGTAAETEVDASRQELLDLKQRFHSLRERRDSLIERIAAVEKEIEEIDARIERRRAEMRDEALGSYQNIGKANQDISRSRAELGLLENEMITLFAEVGRYLSFNCREPACARTARKHRSLISQMQALRASIELNNKLAGREAVG